MKNQAIKYFDEQFEILHPNNKVICKLIGGSTLYGLNNKNSDIDVRGVYSLGSPSEILGLSLYENRGYESFVMNTDEVDASLHELRQFINLLSKTNTQALDVISAPVELYIGEVHPIINVIRDNFQSLISTEKLYHSMRGYIFNEIRLMLGERTGQLGGKRKQALIDYGYSYKNLVQVLRLSFAAETFFKTGVYPVRIKDFSEDLHAELMYIKENPDEFGFDYAKARSESLIDNLEVHYNERTVNYEVDPTLANAIISEYYTNELLELNNPRRFKRIFDSDQDFN